MKKLLLICSLAFLALSAFTQSNIPNGDLESWYRVTITGTSVNYDDPGVGPADNWLATLNGLNAIPAPIGPGPLTVFKTDDKYSGTYAARLTSQYFLISAFDSVFIPGMLGTATLDIAKYRAILGRSCQGCKPVKLNGYYKFESVNGDSCTAVILVSKWNSSTKKRDTIGFGRKFFKNNVTTYTAFEVPVNYNYLSSALPPDSMTLLFVSSGGFNVISFTQSHGQPGSTMYVDALSLDYPAGIQQVLMPEISVNAYPNPASDILHIDLNKEVKNGSFEVYNSAGKLVGSYGMPHIVNTIPVSSLTNGTYFFRLISGKELMNTGSFVIKK